MALINPSKDDKGACLFKTEGAWSDSTDGLLCLPSGTWRTETPILQVEKCTYCGLCYLYCPPQCISPGEDYFPIDLEYCKGCGICAKECPTDAITMVTEGEKADGSA